MVAASNGTYVGVVGSNGVAYKVQGNGTFAGTTVLQTSIVSILGSDTPVGLAYGYTLASPGGVWMLQCTAGGATMHYYFSPDFITWSLGVTTTSAAGASFGLKSIGSLWLATVANSSTSCGVIYSVDGSTWHAVPSSVLTSGATQAPSLAVSDRQAVLVDGSTSQNVRFSTIHGLGPALT
jgi:hypothetical protein